MAPAPSPGASGLAAFPDPLLMRIICFLPPEDVLSLAVTCRHICRLASDDVVWRRLYLHRWPGLVEGSIEEERQPQWKVCMCWGLIEVHVMACSHTCITVLSSSLILSPHRFDTSRPIGSR